MSSNYILEDMIRNRNNFFPLQTKTGKKTVNINFHETYLIKPNSFQQIKVTGSLNKSSIQFNRISKRYTYGWAGREGRRKASLAKTVSIVRGRWLTIHLVQWYTSLSSLEPKSINTSVKKITNLKSYNVDLYKTNTCGRNSQKTEHDYRLQ